MGWSRYTVAFVALLPWLNVSSQPVVSAGLGKGITITAADSSLSCNMAFRIQSLFTGGLNTTTDQYNSDFQIRRSRISLHGFVLSPRLTYKAEIGLSNADVSVLEDDLNSSGSPRLIMDAIVRYQFHEHWKLGVGQAKLPGNRERIVSSGDMQFVDRSLVNASFNIDRDMGVFLYGNYQLGKVIVQPSFAFSQGEGRGITAGNYGGYAYTARLDVLPTGPFAKPGDEYVLSDLLRHQTPKVAFGFTASYNDRAVRQQGQTGFFVRDPSTGEYVQNSLLFIQADAILKYKGFSFLTEAGYTTSEKQPDNLLFPFTTGMGINAQAGYLFANNLELAGRVTHITPDSPTHSSINETTEYTLGVSRYISGHTVKVQGDVSWRDVATLDNRLTARLQLEVGL